LPKPPPFEMTVQVLCRCAGCLFCVPLVFDVFTPLFSQCLLANISIPVAAFQPFFFLHPFFNFRFFFYIAFTRQKCRKEFSHMRIWLSCCLPPPHIFRRTGPGWNRYCLELFDVRGESYGQSASPLPCGIVGARSVCCRNGWIILSFLSFFGLF